MEQPFEPLPHLLVGKVLAALQGCFAKLDSFNEAGFFCEIPADRLLRERVRVAASVGGEFCKLVLLLGREMYFHACQCKGAGPGLSTGVYTIASRNATERYDPRTLRSPQGRLLENRSELRLLSAKPEGARLLAMRVVEFLQSCHPASSRARKTSKNRGAWKASTALRLLWRDSLSDLMNVVRLFRLDCGRKCLSRIR